MSIRSRRAVLLGATAMTLSACAALPEQGQAPGARERPEFWSDRSYYLEMRDGVGLALSLYFPEAREPASPAPTILVQTRYGRAGQMRSPELQMWRAHGYVVAVIDTRGTTSSFGVRMLELGSEEQRDMDEIIAHIAAQPWSNGRVIAAGVSYMGDTADLATSRPAPALVGAIPRQVDFDGYAHLIAPGGVINDFMLTMWGGGTLNMDLGQWERDGRTLQCVQSIDDCRALFPMLQPVDGDDNYVQLRAALRNRRRWQPGDYLALTFRDDIGANGHNIDESAPAMQIEAIRRERKPVMYWGSWLDAGTAEAALARFRSAPEVPAELWITGNDHGNRVSADPFGPADAPPHPSLEEQYARMRSFAERVQTFQPIGRVINYYVLGAGVYRQTDVWPPTGLTSARLYLNGDNTLATSAGAQRIMRYEVDLSVGTGERTRWSTQIGTPPAYGDRAETDRRLLVFDSAPMRTDMELAGAPIINLEVAAHTQDPAFFVYLEDVAPDGRVTYITEGMLRAIHRRPADPTTLPYDAGPAPHTYRRADAMPVTPGAFMHVRFALFPTAALIRTGHRLRVAIAGADASVFHIYSGGGPEVFEIHAGGATPSSLEVAMRPWTP